MLDWGCQTKITQPLSWSHADTAGGCPMSNLKKPLGFCKRVHCTVAALLQTPSEESVESNILATAPFRRQYYMRSTLTKFACIKPKSSRSLESWLFPVHTKFKVRNMSNITYVDHLTVGSHFYANNATLSFF